MCERWLCNGLGCVNCNNEFKMFFETGMKLYDRYQRMDWCTYIEHTERVQYKCWCVTWWNKCDEKIKVRLREIAKQKYEILYHWSHRNPHLEWLHEVVVNKPPYTPLPYVSRNLDLSTLSIEMQAIQNQFPDRIRNLLNVILKNICDDEPGDVTEKTNMRDYCKWYYLDTPITKEEVSNLQDNLKNSLMRWLFAIRSLDIYKYYVEHRISNVFEFNR